MLWHLLDANSPWLKEFAAALGTLAPTINWSPEIRNFGLFEKWERKEAIDDPAIEVIKFPIQRAYGRFPLAQMLPMGSMIVQRLVAADKHPEQATLICTNPYYASVAEQWPGKVIYYLTDLTKAYAGMNPSAIVPLDRRMCRVAHRVCPNSIRIAEYLATEAGCPENKLTVIPNATRASNVLTSPLTRPLTPPADLADLPRPIVGIIGNLGNNMDWHLIREAVTLSNEVSWAFVGPTGDKLFDEAQNRARRDVMSLGGRVRFTGGKPYGELCFYARCFDAAVLPYRKHEPTFSGSATRFYEHLAACRPILSSRGFHELLSKEPLLQLFDSGEDLVKKLDKLKDQTFEDGQEEARWTASRSGTWLVRARSLMEVALRTDCLHQTDPVAMVPDRQWTAAVES